MKNDIFRVEEATNQENGASGPDIELSCSCCSGCCGCGPVIIDER